MSEPCLNVDKLTDHEIRIRKLEDSTIEMKYNFISLESSNKDIKLMINDVIKGQNDLLNKFVNSTLNNAKVDSTIKKNNNDKLWSILFKVWAISAPIITGLAIYFQK